MEPHLVLTKKVKLIYKDNVEENSRRHYRRDFLYTKSEKRSNQFFLQNVEIIQYHVIYTSTSKKQRKFYKEVEYFEAK